VPPDRIELGSVVGVFGVRGEVRLHLHNREDSVLAQPRPVWLRGVDGVERPAAVSVRPGAGKRIIGRVEGVTTPEAAAELVGAAVLIDRDQLPEPHDGEYYVADLLGLSVEDEAGTVLGTLSDVVPGERDVWVVALDQGDAFLLPGPDTVLRVDPEAGVIVVAEGALTAGE
jgi:16S rRNA processing protein RimM